MNFAAIAQPMAPQKPAKSQRSAKFKSSFVLMLMSHSLRRRKQAARFNVVAFCVVLLNALCWLGVIGLGLSLFGLG